MKNLLSLGALAGALPLTTVYAQVPLPFVSPMFTDNMVLQRGMSDPVWGWAAPGAKVTVTMDGRKTEATAGPDGKWVARIGPFKAGGPYTLAVGGAQSRVFKNVLVGDVWVCSGQSNMEFGIGNATNAPAEIATANYPNIRLFTVTKKIAADPQMTLSGQWDVCTPDTVKAGGWNGFTAVGYFFGRELNQKLHIPIGLIHTSWGGTPAEAWTSGPALNTMADYKAKVAAIDADRAARSNGGIDIRRAIGEWYAKNDPGSAPGASWSNPVADVSNWPTMSLPGLTQDAGIPALASVNGIFWFRKEIELPEDTTRKAVTLHFVADDNDTAWINGVPVGATEGFNVERAYNVPAGVLKAGKNVIAIRVLDTGGKGGIYGNPDQLTLEVPGGATVPLAGPWQYRLAKDLKQTTAYPMDAAHDQNAPTVLYNGMIAPVAPFGIKGALWYQGESNAGRAYQYRTLLPTMIADWRASWGQGSFPFYVVQLANFMAAPTKPGDSAWAELREAQSMTARDVPNSGLAVAIDVGDAGDIHPKDKQDVGHRLALNALARDYGQKIEYSGPNYKSMKVEGNAVRLTFDHLGGGMVAKGGKLTGFAIAGDDKQWAWADARIDGDSIVVTSPEVAHPAAVRYAWSDNPPCNLYNAAGLPASPFRTDNWPGVTMNNR